MLFSKKNFVVMIVPLIIEQILSIFIGTADSTMVSAAGEAAISGVTLVDTVNNLLIYVFTALTTGGAVVSSQMLGTKNMTAARDSAKQLIYATTILATVITVFAVAFGSPLLRLMFGDVEANIMSNAKTYFIISALSYPALALYNCGAALFRSMGNTKTPMLISVFMNTINIVGNAILIYGFKMGAAGAAIATVVARTVSAFWIIALLYNKKNPIYIEKIFKFKPNWFIMKRILGIGVPSGLENGIFQFGKLLTQSLIATFGAAAIAANGAANVITHFHYIAGTAVGAAIVPIVGRCIGARDKKQAKYYARTLIFISYAAVIVSTALVTVFLKPLIGLYNLSDEAAEITRNLALYHAIFICTVWPTAFPLVNVFRAASDVKYPLIISVVSMWVFRVGLSYVLEYVFHLGIYSVWIAMTCDWTFRCIIFLIHYLRGKWLNKYIPPEKELIEE